jgi:excisionase family DNA binding protein
MNTPEELCARPWATVPPSGPILRTKQAAEYLGIGYSRFFELVNAGHLPRPFTVHGRTKGLPKPWLDAVVAHAARQVAS